MSKKIKNLGDFNDRKKAYDKMFDLSKTLVTGNKKTGKKLSMKVESKGSTHTIWLMED